MLLEAERGKIQAAATVQNDGVIAAARDTEYAPRQAWLISNSVAQMGWLQDLAGSLGVEPETLLVASGIVGVFALCHFVMVMRCRLGSKSMKRNVQEPCPHGRTAARFSSLSGAEELEDDGLPMGGGEQ